MIGSPNSAQTSINGDGRRLALVLAAHGCGVGSATNRLVKACARELARRVVCDRVVAAFHRGLPRFSAVLDDLDAHDIVVVPLMTSEGFYSRVVLPRELAKSSRLDSVRVHHTPPLGSHPEVSALVARRVQQRLAEFHLLPQETTLVVVGHGTKRHASSRNVTERLAKTLQAESLCGEVLHAFLDEQPFVESIHCRAGKSNLLVVPFLIGGGEHAVRDIPAALGLSPSDRVRTGVRIDCDQQLPYGRGPDRWRRGSDEQNGDGDWPQYCGVVDGRLVVCDAAVGTDPTMVDIVEQLSRRAIRELRSRAPGAAGYYYDVRSVDTIRSTRGSTARSVLARGIA